MLGKPGTLAWWQRQVMEQPASTPTASSCHNQVVLTATKCEWTLQRRYNWQTVPVKPLAVTALHLPALPLAFLKFPPHNADRRRRSFQTGLCWEGSIRLTLPLTTVDCSSNEAQRRKEAARICQEHLKSSIEQPRWDHFDHLTCRAAAE